MWLLCLLLLVSGKCAQSQLSQRQRDRLLNDHNRYRAGISPRACPPLPAMKWDTRLEKVAQAYADKCDYSHNTQRVKQTNGTFLYVGENVWYSATARSTIRTDVGLATSAWHQEVMDYNLSSNRCRPGRVCGQYTQVVWDKSTSIGCGAKVCPNGITINDPFRNRFPTAFIIVCNYGPGGNIGGRRPYTPCSPPTATKTPASATAVPTTTSSTITLPTTTDATTSSAAADRESTGLGRSAEVENRHSDLNTESDVTEYEHPVAEDLEPSSLFSEELQPSKLFPEELSVP